MSILSLPAVARLAERHCRQHRQPIPRAELLKSLEALGVERSRAEAGVRLATTCGRLIDTPSGLAIPALDEGMAAA
jgi:hypothetical protein